VSAGRVSLALLEGGGLIRMEQALHERGRAEEARLPTPCRAPGCRTNRPIGSFIFLGPPASARPKHAPWRVHVWSGQRIDMSEYQEKHTVSRLVGAPPGYVGYEEGGQLTEAVRRRPYSVVLFDEIEKAHSEVFNVLLQLLDDGRLTDGQGRTVDFRNTVVIMTSNLGNQLWEGGHQVMRDEITHVLQAHFRPEFLNRIDEIVIFHPLTRENLAEIVDIQLRRVRQLLEERGYHLVINPEASQYLADIGYDPDFGARPLKRAIQRELQDPLAMSILSGEFQEGDTIQVNGTPDGLVFTTGRPEMVGGGCNSGSDITLGVVLIIKIAPFFHACPSHQKNQDDHLVRCIIGITMKQPEVLMPTETVHGLIEPALSLSDRFDFPVVMAQPDGVSGSDLLPLSLIGSASGTIASCANSASR
jgi:hypothetical protein